MLKTEGMTLAQRAEWIASACPTIGTRTWRGVRDRALLTLREQDGETYMRGLAAGAHGAACARCARAADQANLARLNADGPLSRFIRRLIALRR